MKHALDSSVSPVQSHELRRWLLVRTARSCIRFYSLPECLLCAVCGCMGWCQVEDEILVHQASCAMGIDGLEELAAEYASASAYYEAAKTKVGALLDTLARYAISLSLNYTYDPYPRSKPARRNCERSLPSQT